jgi:hypothetical protein
MTFDGSALALLAADINVAQSGTLPRAPGSWTDRAILGERDDGPACRRRRRYDKVEISLAPRGRVPTPGRAKA